MMHWVPQKYAAEIVMRPEKRNAFGFMDLRE